MMNVQSQSTAITSPEVTVPDNLEILAQTAASQASDLQGLPHNTHLYPVLRLGEHVPLGLPLLGHPQIRIEGQPGGPMLSQAQIQKILGGSDFRLDADKGVSPGPLSIVPTTFGDPGQPSPAPSGAGDAMLSAINYNDNEMLHEGGFDVSSHLGSLDDGLLGNPGNMRLSESSTSHPFDLFDGDGDSLNMESLSPSGLIMSDPGIGSVSTESSVGDLSAESGSQLKEEKKKQKPRTKQAKVLPIAGKVGALECDQCHKIFTNTSALAKHKLTHSEERKYLCAVCEKKFKRQDHLNGHMMTHRDKKPYQCTVKVCDKSYCDARSLRRHFENHHQFSPEQISSAMVVASTCAAEILADVSNSISTQPVQQPAQTSPPSRSPGAESVSSLPSAVLGRGIVTSTKASVTPEKAIHVMPSTVVTTASLPTALAEPGAAEGTPSLLTYEQLVQEQRHEQQQQQTNLQLIRIQQMKQNESAQKQQQQLQSSGASWKDQALGATWQEQLPGYQLGQVQQSPSSQSQSPDKEDLSPEYSAMSPLSPKLVLGQVARESPVPHSTWYSVPTPPQAEAAIHISQAAIGAAKAEELAKPVVCSICQRRFKNVPALNGHMRLHGGYFKKEAALKEERKKKGEMAPPYSIPTKSSHNSPGASALPLEVAPQTGASKESRQSPFQPAVQSPPQDSKPDIQQELQLHAMHWMEKHQSSEELQQKLQMAQQAQLQLLQISSQSAHTQQAGNPGQPQLPHVATSTQIMGTSQSQQMVDKSQVARGGSQPQQQISVMGRSPPSQHLPQLDMEQLQQLQAGAIHVGQQQLQQVEQQQHITEQQMHQLQLQQQQQEQQQLQQQQQEQQQLQQQQQEQQQLQQQQQEQQQLQQQQQEQQQIEQQQKLLEEQQQKIIEEKQQQIRQQQELLQQQQFEQHQKFEQRQAFIGRHNPSYMSGLAQSPQVPQSPGTPTMPQSPMMNASQYVAHSPMLQRQESVESVQSPVDMNQSGQPHHEFPGLHEGVDMELLHTIQTQLRTHPGIHTITTQAPTTVVQGVSFNSMQGGLPGRYEQVTMNPSVNIHHSVASAQSHMANTFASAHITAEQLAQVTMAAKSASNEIVSQIISDLQSAEDNMHVGALQPHESINAQNLSTPFIGAPSFNRELPSTIVFNKTSFSESSHNPHVHSSHISPHNPPGFHISHNQTHQSEGLSSNSVKQEILKHLAAKPSSPRAAHPGGQFLFQNSVNGRTVAGDALAMESPLSPIQQQNTELTRRLSAGLDDVTMSHMAGNSGVHSDANKDGIGTYVKPAPMDCDSPVRHRMRSQSGDMASETVRPRLRSKSGDHHLHRWVSEDHSFIRPKLRTDESHRPRSKTDEHLARWANREILSQSDGADVFRNPSYFPSSFKIKRKNRPAPLIIPPHANHGGFQSRLRSPRIWHEGVDLNHSASVPYTPPPMLSPLRRGSGLFWSIYGSLTSAPPSASPLARTASIGEVEPTLSELEMAPETDTQPHVNIGPQYQPILPNYNSNKGLAQYDQSKEDLLWDPHCIADLTDDDVQCYQELACCAAVQGNGSNVEHALHLLHLAQGDSQKAMLMLMTGEMTVPPGHSLTNYVYQESEEWSCTDVENYSQALFKHDKDFFRLAGEMKTRSVKQCIQFYYVWKKAMPEDHKRLRMMRRKREQLYNLRSRQQTTQQQPTQQEGSGNSETTEPAVEDKPDFDEEDDDGTESSTTCGTVDDQNDEKEDERELREMTPLYDSPAPSSNPSPILAFPCDYPECNSSFSSKPALNAHLKIHVRARRSPSPARPVVHAPNPTVSNKRHDRVHPVPQSHSPANNGEEPVFACKVCGRVFAKVKSRSAHMKIHRPDQDKKTNQVKVKQPPKPPQPPQPPPVVVDNYPFSYVKKPG